MSKGKSPKEIAQHGAMQELDFFAQKLPVKFRNEFYRVAILAFGTGIGEGTKIGLGVDDNQDGFVNYMEQQREKCPK